MVRRRLEIVAGAALVSKVSDQWIVAIWLVASAYCFIAFLITTRMSNKSKKLIEGHLKRRSWAQLLTIDPLTK